MTKHNEAWVHLTNVFSRFVCSTAFRGQRIKYFSYILKTVPLFLKPEICVHLVVPPSTRFHASAIFTFFLLICNFLRTSPPTPFSSLRKCSVPQNTAPHTFPIFRFHSLFCSGLLSSPPGCHWAALAFVANPIAPSFRKCLLLSLGTCRELRSRMSRRIIAHQVFLILLSVVFWNYCTRKIPLIPSKYQSHFTHNIPLTTATSLITRRQCVARRR